MWRLTCLPLFLVLTATQTCRAGFYVRAAVCRLTAGIWQLRATDQRVYLVEGLRSPPQKWSVSAPTIKAENHKFLASDPQGLSPAVQLANEKGDHTKWAFEFLHRFQPQKVGRGLEGTSGFTFRVKMAAGPFENWYLAAEEAGPGQEERSLKLVREVKDATVFTYVEADYKAERS